LLKAREIARLQSQAGFGGRAPNIGNANFVKGGSAVDG
jgi:hypothetical protein